MWGSKGKGIDDLIEKVKSNKLKSLFIMRQRKFDCEECLKLCRVLRKNESLREVRRYFSSLYLKKCPFITNKHVLIHMLLY